MEDSQTPHSSAPLTPAAPPLDEASLLRHLQESFGLSREDATAMMESAKRGETLSDYYGVTQETLNSYENVAVALYNQHQYEQAENIFVLLSALTQGKNGSYWRGQAACRQGKLDYPGAIAMYLNALFIDPCDTLSSVYLAECLLTVGQIDNAKTLLTDINEKSGPADPEEAPHIKRARAMLKNIDQQARHRAQDRQQRAPATQPRKSAPQATQEAAPQPTALELPEGAFEPDDVVPEPVASDPEIREMMAQPDIKAKFEELAELVEENFVTIREIADFSPEQMDAGYAVCCALLEQRNYPKALEIAGWMLHIDSQDSRFYQAAGLCAFNLGLFCLAEHLFNMDTIWRKTGPDAATLVYKAEALLRQNEVPQGLAVLAEGIELAGNKRDYQQIVKRAKTLQQVYNSQAVATT